jgi:hypothetical protein
LICRSLIEHLVPFLHAGLSYQIASEEAKAEQSSRQRIPRQEPAVIDRLKKQDENDHRSARLGRWMGGGNSTRVASFNSLGSGKNFLWEEVFFSGASEVHQNQHASHVLYRANESSFSRQQHACLLGTDGFPGF